MPSLLSYYARDNFPFADNFNQLVQRSLEYGFPQHFDRISKYKLYFQDNRRKEINDDANSDGKVIEMSELMHTLILFMVGMGVSCVIFVLEVVWAKIEPKILKWIELKTKQDLIKVIQEQNQGFMEENLFEFVK